MFNGCHLLTVELDGTRYRGAYRVEGEELIIEAHGLGKKIIDATIVEGQLGEPTKRLAQLAFAEFIKENAELDGDRLSLAVQGATTQVALFGIHA